MIRLIRRGCKPLQQLYTVYYGTVQGQFYMHTITERLRENMFKGYSKKYNDAKLLFVIREGKPDPLVDGVTLYDYTQAGWLVDNLNIKECKELL